jgi:hypothetical protein
MKNYPLIFRISGIIYLLIGAYFAYTYFQKINIMHEVYVSMTNLYLYLALSIVFLIQGLIFVTIPKVKITRTLSIACVLTSIVIAMPLILSCWAYIDYLSTSNKEQWKDWALLGFGLMYFVYLAIPSAILQIIALILSLSAFFKKVKVI